MATRAPRRARPQCERRHLRGVPDAPAGRAELVERDSAEGGRQPDRAADLVLDPCHAGLIGPHVRAEDVVVLAAKRVRERPDEPLFFVGRHAGVAAQDGFAAAVRKARGGVLQRHRAREANALLDAHVRRHA